MKIIDISWPLSERTTGYKNRSVLQVTHRKTYANDKINETSALLDMHGGTHVDAPYHMSSDGKTIDQIPLERLYGNALVIDCMQEFEYITADTLRMHDIAQGQIVLCKTKNSLLAYDAPFDPAFVYLHESGTQYLKEKKIKAFGIDYLGLERSQPGHPSHNLLLSNNISVVEGLRLAHVDAGQYEAFILPLALVGLDAAPARAVLISRS